MKQKAFEIKPTVHYINDLINVVNFGIIVIYTNYISLLLKIKSTQFYEGSIILKVVGNQQNTTTVLEGLVLSNQRLAMREIAEELGISKGSCHAILAEKLRMDRVATKLFLKLLTLDQEDNRIAISQELFGWKNGDEIFMSRIIPGDETWVYGYDAQMKVQSSQWVVKSSPRLKADEFIPTRQSLSACTTWKS